MTLDTPDAVNVKRILLAAHAREGVAIAYQQKAAEEHWCARCTPGPYVTRESVLYFQGVTARHYRMARLACGFDEATEPLYA